MHPLHIAALLCAAILFWYLRASYWDLISEEPFSDMADYKAQAERFLCCGMLEHSSFWKSYLKPSLAVFGAGVFAVVGEGNMFGWRIVLGCLTFFSLLWLAREIAWYTRSWWLGIACLAVVAISKSSIFWSYKFATEGYAEALLYLLCACVLCLHRSRRPRYLAHVFLGIVAMAALYNRPNVALGMPLIPLSILMSKREPGAGWLKGWNFSSLIAFGIGCALVVVPYVARGYNLYGAFLASPTQGPYSFLWELGAVPITLEDGTVVQKGAVDLQNEAPQKFANDYEAANFAKMAIRQWMAANWDDVYPNLIRHRFFSTIESKDIALSRVPRATLFPGWQENILIDKTGLFFALGCVGLLLFACTRRGPLYIITGSALLSWLFAIFFLSDPRVLEPSLPIVLFGNVALIFVLVTWSRKIMPRGATRTTQER